MKTLVRGALVVVLLSAGSAHGVFNLFSASDKAESIKTADAATKDLGVFSLLNAYSDVHPVKTGGAALVAAYAVWKYGKDLLSPVQYVYGKVSGAAASVTSCEPTAEAAPAA